MRVHGFLLTGGRSSRMGQDKASIMMGDHTLAERIVQELGKFCEQVTVLGPKGIAGASDFVPDEQDFPGPLFAVSRIATQADAFFLASCDLPGFRAELFEVLSLHLDQHDAAIPLVGGREQPLCGLYRVSSLKSAKRLLDSGERRVMTWLSGLDVARVNLEDVGLEHAAANVNTPAELKSTQP